MGKLVKVEVTQLSTNGTKIIVKPERGLASAASFQTAMPPRVGYSIKALGIRKVGSSPDSFHPRPCCNSSSNSKTENLSEHQGFGFSIRLCEVGFKIIKGKVLDDSRKSTRKEKKNSLNSYLRIVNR